MKKYILLLLITAISFAQNPTRNVGGFATIGSSDTMHPSAIIEARSTTKGCKLSGGTETQRNAISNPINGLIWYNTTTNAYNYWDGDSWETFGGGGGSQNLQSVLNIGGRGVRFTPNNVDDVVFELADRGKVVLKRGNGDFFLNSGIFSVGDELIFEAVLDGWGGGVSFDLDTQIFVNGVDVQGSAVGISSNQRGYLFLSEKVSGIEYWIYRVIDESPNSSQSLSSVLNTGNTANNSILLDEGAGGWNIKLDPAGYGITVEDTSANLQGFVTELSIGAKNLAESKYAFLDVSTSDGTLTLLSTSSTGRGMLKAPNLTGNRTLSIPDASGTIALTSDLSDKADLNGSTSEDFLVPTVPATANSAASKNYIDNALTGLTWKNAVKCSTTANHSLSGTSNVDGVTVPAGTRVLVRFQSTPAQNGIYISASGVWSRATDADSGAELTETTVLVTSGTLFKNTQWTQNGTVTTVGTDAVTFVQVAGAGTYTNGDGIDLTANVFSVDSSVTRNTASQTLTNKTIDGASNSISNIAQSSVSNLVSDLANKQNALGFTPENVANKQTNLTASATNYPTVNAVNTGLDLRMSKSANGSDIANVATFRSNIGLDKIRLTVDATGNTTHTGTIAETKVATLFAPANTFDSVCYIYLTYNFMKNTGSAIPIRVYVNTTDSLSGATLLGLYTTGSNRNVDFTRKFLLRGTTLDLLGDKASRVTNINNDNVFGASASETITPTTDLYFIISVALDATGSVATNKIATLEKQKL